MSTSPKNSRHRLLLSASLLAAPLLAIPGLACASPTQTFSIYSNQTITIPGGAYGATFQTLNPGLPDHPKYLAGQALNSQLSPDGTTLLVLTSGYNSLSYSSGPNAGQYEASASNEYIFVYNVVGSFQAQPVLQQVIPVPNSFIGLRWTSDSSKFYVSGGVSDNVLSFTRNAGTWTQASSVALGHTSYAQYFTGLFAPLGAFVGSGLGFEESASAAGLALSPDNSLLAVTNIFNDSLSVINTATNTVLWEYDLRPYKNNPTASGTAGGETPLDVVITGTAATGFTAYVSSVRDREIVVVPLGANPPAQGTLQRIPLPGSPNRMVLSADQSTLYVAQDNSDTVAVINTATNTVTEEIPTAAPPGYLTIGTQYTGAAPNNVALSPDGTTLYVTNGGANSVAVIPLAGPAPHSVAGLIPTGWYPHSVTVSADGKTLFITNGKSKSAANPGYENSATNEYVEQIEHAGLMAIKVPNPGILSALALQVISNNNYAGSATPADIATMAALHQKIQHVIYIIKENRTYDQVLGDLHNGAAGDPKLTMYGASITPNFHHLAKDFVTLDHFYTSGEVSGDGWAWSTEGRESDFGTKTIPMNYAGRGASNDCEGDNRDVGLGGPTATRISYFPNLFNVPSLNLYSLITGVFPGGTANLLPGINNDFATDGPAGTPPQQGYIWDAALRAGLSVRSYGYFADLSRYNIPASDGGAALIENPALQTPPVTMYWPTNPTLAPVSDPYYRGFDNAYPDAWREEEWKREFDGFVANKNLPNLSLVRLMHDHTGNYTGSIVNGYVGATAGLGTPELEQADNDFGVGKVVEAVAGSIYAGNTLIFVLEDDSQDGPDHIDSHRSTAYVVGPYVKRNAIISTQYNTVNMVRTIEDVLAIGHLNINDAGARPMSDLFDMSLNDFNYSAYASGLLKNTGLAPLLPTNPGLITNAAPPTHTAAYWAAKTKGYDWSHEDRVPTAQYNKILWEGIMGGKAPDDAVKSAPTADHDND